MIERAEEWGPRPLLFRRYRGLITGFMRSEHVYGTSLAARMISFHMGWTDAMGQPEYVPSSILMRSGLTVWACAACGGDVREALAAACGIEWLHYVTQDYGDEDIVDPREGRWTAEARHALGLMVSLQTYGGRGRPASVSVAIARAAAEQLQAPSADLEFERVLEVTPRTYLRMAAAKTAFLRACFETGAIAAGASPERRAIFRRAGRLLGIAFQICDDVLLMYGDRGCTGTSSTGNARLKMAFPVLAGIRAMSQEQRKNLAEILYLKDDDREVRLRALLDEVGAEALARKAALRYAAKAADVIARAGLNPHAMNEFKEVAHYFATRTR